MNNFVGKYSRSKLLVTSCLALLLRLSCAVQHSRRGRRGRRTEEEQEEE